MGRVRRKGQCPVRRAPARTDSKTGLKWNNDQEPAKLPVFPKGRYFKWEKGFQGQP